MSERPKYLWFSLIAYLLITYQCRNIILHDKKRDYNLWFSFIKFELLWGSIILFMPSGVIVFLLYVFSDYSSTAELIINIIGLIYLYFGGVILSSKLYDWKNKNLVKNIRK